jgi:hypothetical protein
MATFAFARLMIVGGIVAALACARNPEDETGAAPRDTARNGGMIQRDTTNRDTTGVYAPTPSRDTAMQHDTTGMRRDTAGYSGMERDTTYRDTSEYRKMRDSARTPMPTDTSNLRRDSAQAGQWRDTTMTPGVRRDSASTGTSAQPKSGGPS